MQRTMPLVLAAGVAGAVFTTLAGSVLSTPAVASDSGGVYQADGTTGVVDVLSLLEQMLDTDEYATPREVERGVWTDQITTLEAELNGTIAQLQQLDPNNPDPTIAQPLYQQYQGLQQRLSQVQQQSQMEMDRFSAGQLAEAYARIHAAVQTVAEANGVEQVFSTRLTADDIEATNTNVVVQEVLLRPVLRDATGTNLTPLVRAELGIPEPSEEPEADAAGPDAPEPAPAGDGG